MRIRIVSPAATGIMTGNRVTAARWSRVLRSLGHEVRVTPTFARGACDVLVALHAAKSALAVDRFTARHPHRPIVVALTGTDVYGDFRRQAEALDCIRRAWRIVALQPLVAAELPGPLRRRVHVIHQSAHPPRRRPRPREQVFEVCVVGHLREVKDPLLAARAVALLAAASRIHVTHIGGVLDADLAARARRESRCNPRYEWVGAMSRARTLSAIARARLLVLTSRLEGGANVVSEAVVWGTPVISTRIAGSIGLLGEDYPGFFPVGDAASLAELLRRAETDADFLDRLSRRCASVAPRFDPSRERDAWRRLLDGLTEAVPDSP